MDHLNALPQVLVGFFIVWLVVTATSILVCVWRVSQVVGTIEHWYDDWLDFKLRESPEEDIEPEPEPPVERVRETRSERTTRKATKRQRRHRRDDD